MAKRLNAEETTERTRVWSGGSTKLTARSSGMRYLFMLGRAGRRCRG